VTELMRCLVRAPALFLIIADPNMLAQHVVYSNTILPHLDLKTYTIQDIREAVDWFLNVCDH
jgi:hypothetical protein